MGGKQSKHTEHFDDNEQTPSTSASQPSNTSPSTGDTAFMYAHKINLLN